MTTKFQNLIFVIAAMLLTSTFVIAQSDTTNDDWTNNSSPGSQNELNRTAITTTDEAAAKITFGSGTGSIITYGLNAESVPLPAGTKGAQAGVRGKTASNYGAQAGYAEGRLAYSKSFVADGSFIGTFGVGRASALSTFDPTVPFSFSLGGFFSGGSESGTTLDIDGDKVHVGGSYNILTGDINGTPAEGAVAAVIGIDESTGTAPSHAGYFYKTATTSGDNALHAEMPRPTDFSGGFSAITGTIESGYGYARGVLGSSYTQSPQTDGRAYGVWAQAGNATENFGMYARLLGQNKGTAILGHDEVGYPGWSGILPANDTWAGYFVGDVHTTETLSIGTTNRPTTLGGQNLSNYRLYVCGGILAQELFVNNSAWCDYVFDTDYTLTSLEDVESHIEEKGHLHNTPSEAEIATNEGFEIGEMTRNQQEKIEEIFLHLIDLNEQIKQLKAENTTLKIQVEQSQR